MTEPKPRPEPFNLGLHTARLLIDEPFFAAFSSRIDKVATTAIPTAAIGVNPTTGHFTMYYNAEFVASLPDHQKRGIIKHEFYHLIFDHVTSRAPADGIKRIHNIAMDLSINGNEGIRKELPREEDPGPMMASGKPMLACMPGEGPFEHLPAGMSYEWYLERLKEMADEDKSKGKPGDGTGEPQDGDPFGDMDSLDSHDGFGEGDGTLNEIAKERLKEGLKKAAMAAKKSGNWGSVSSETRKRIMDSIVTTVDWRSVLRGFVQKSQRANKRSNPRRVNRRFRYIHPGKTVRRQARVAISIDQSGSVSDRMLATFFAELENLADIAEFTVIPFDTSVDEKKVYVWKKGEKRPWERVLCGGTCFNAPTDYVNKEEFDGHIVLTDMEAPKPRPSKCQRMWMTTKACAERPYFQTNERVVPIG